MPNQSVQGMRTQNMSAQEMFVQDSAVHEKVFVPLNDDLEHQLADMRCDAVNALGDLVPFRLDVAPVMTFKDGLFTLTYLPDAS